MAVESAQVALWIKPGQADRVDVEQLEALAIQLREELLELDVEQVELARAGEPPPGARAVEAAAIGGLVVTVAKSAGPLLAVVNTLRSWLARNQSRGVHLVIDGKELEATGLSAAEQQRLIDAWLSRVGPVG